MQNVVHDSKCDSPRDNDLNDSNKDHSEPSSPLNGNLSGIERGPSLSSLQSHFMAEISDSDDDYVSEVESFILEQEDQEDDIESDEPIPLVDGVDFDLDTQYRLEALLEACKVDNPVFDADSSESSSNSGDGSCDKKYDQCNKLYWEKLPQSTLAEAVTNGDLVAVKRLLEEGRNVNEVTESGESLIYLAASCGYYELTQLLLAMKANIEDRGLKDKTPLMEAAEQGNTEIVKLLLQHGADVNAQICQDKKKATKIKACDMKPQTELQQQQLQQQLQQQQPVPEGNTPLIFACAAGHVDTVRLLLDAGASLEVHNENGHTPLMETASAGHVEVAKLLVERGASINTHSNEFKESALTLACYKGHLEMVRFLLEAGADREHKTDEMHTALMEASMDGHVEVARLLLDSGAQVNMPADSFESPLTLAACGGHVELAMLLLDRGANIEEVNDEGYTPLMEAAREGHEEMVALLLSQGADINAQTEETQETALTLACCGGFLEVSDFLIKAGADISNWVLAHR
ncbi:hypothetical protein JTE90_008988 [Oedothorax gibbosus]|uniref:Ankyrin repeat and KH domain-containing protein 1 n=1 Tax=Oedothorax gibbosus TaxID=931172 RepID=A0AAV6UJL5_9ARAC|nr:hypothetical protein JTE90_008988 [Oedothorax gibbosus]